MQSCLSSTWGLPAVLRNLPCGTLVLSPGSETSGKAAPEQQGAQSLALPSGEVLCWPARAWTILARLARLLTCAGAGPGCMHA